MRAPKARRTMTGEHFLAGNQSGRMFSLCDAFAKQGAWMVVGGGSFLPFFSYLWTCSPLTNYPTNALFMPSAASSHADLPGDSIAARVVRRRGGGGDRGEGGEGTCPRRFPFLDHLPSCPFTFDPGCWMIGCLANKQMLPRWGGPAGRARAGALPWRRTMVPGGGRRTSHTAERPPPESYVAMKSVTHNGTTRMMKKKLEVSQGVA